MYWGNGMGGWGYLFMVFNSLVFWALLIVAVLLLVRYLGGRPSGRRNAGWSGAERVLAERYARGEIDDEEYQRRLATLRSASTPPATS